MIPLDILQCPRCGAILEEHQGRLSCTSKCCGMVYPVVQGIPLLICETRSVFRWQEIIARHDPFFNQSSGPSHWLGGLIPSLSKNYVADRNLRELAERLLRKGRSPLLLVVGAGLAGEGMDQVIRHPSIRVVRTDVRVGGTIDCVCDAHDLPFHDETFDAVILQAVLEHVLEPGRCVEETHRVLKTDGIVYAETPFMQQVHGGRHDFTRYTRMGHRWLFRRFAEIKSGPVGGPGMALAWSVRYFCLSFASARWARRLLIVGSALLLFWLKYVDALLLKNPASQDGASGFFFMGIKSSRGLLSSELLGTYVGS